MTQPEPTSHPPIIVPAHEPTLAQQLAGAVYAANVYNFTTKIKTSDGRHAYIIASHTWENIVRRNEQP